MPRVSLITATYNEMDTINQKIENIANIDYPKDLLEIVFVDASTDNTVQIIEDFKLKTPLRVLVLKEKTRRGLASALNSGYALGKGEIIIKNDCDLILEKDSIKEIVKYFSDPRIGAVSGAVSVSNQCDVEKGYRSIYDRLRVAEANLDSTYIFNTFCAFRKNLIEPIDTKSVADDAELALKIRKKGYRIVFCPEAIAYEASPTTIRERINQKSRRAQGQIKLIFQNLKFLFNPRFGKFGLVVFPANFFMMILSPWLFLAIAVLGVLYLSTIFGFLFALLMFAAVASLGLLVYLKAKPRILAGFLDAQLNLIIGALKLVAKGPDYIWAKETCAREIGSSEGEC